MSQTAEKGPLRTWGTVRIGTTALPVRWVMLWGAGALWLAVILFHCGPSGLTALAFNLSFLLALFALTSGVRSVTTRTLLFLFLAGAASLGLAAMVSRIFQLQYLSATRGLMEPLSEELIKLLPVLIVLVRYRKFSLWTLGISDLLLMGAASGAGFAIAYDAFAHVNRHWEHQIKWLPVADLLNGFHLFIGHAGLTAIASALLGMALFLIHRKKIAAIIAAAGVGIATVLHMAAALTVDNNPMAPALNAICFNGQASVPILFLLLATAIVGDSLIQWKGSPRLPQFRLPRREEFAEGLAGLWDFVLDRRRLAYANFRRRFLPDNANLNMTVAVLSQCLVNAHQPPQMARAIAAMSAERAESTLLIDAEELPEALRDDPLMTGEGLQLPEQYQLISRLSIGGMGAIYKGRHRKTNALVAVKVLHPHISAREQYRLRFEREAQAASQLKHPNLVVIHDYGMTQRSTPYIVMELIEGSTLRQEIGRTKGLPPQRFFPIFDQVCDALAHAHRRGVIHRDIKPSNIILTRTDSGNDFVKVVDFGIAKVVSKQDMEGQELTQTGDIIGSPLYMSPEQCVGDALDIRADIYSVGCVLYEAITGKPPLIAENTVKTIFKHLNVDPDPLSVARPDLNVPPAVEAVIFKAMAKDKSQRYSSMDELRDALNRARGAVGNQPKSQ